MEEVMKVHENLETAGEYNMIDNSDIAKSFFAMSVIRAVLQDLTFSLGEVPRYLEQMGALLFSLQAKTTPSPTFY